MSNKFLFHLIKVHSPGNYCLSHKNARALSNFEFVSSASNALKQSNQFALHFQGRAELPRILHQEHDANGQISQ